MIAAFFTEERRKMKPIIITFGEIIWDVYPDARHIGGAAFNFASHAAKCGAGSVLVSAVGNDGLGDMAVTCAEGFGVGTSMIKRTSEPTGQCLVTLDEKKIPSFTVLQNAAYDNISLSDGDIGKIREMRPQALYFGTLIQRSPASRGALGKLTENVAFPEIVCDINLRKGCYTAQSARFCLKKATVLKLSDEEEPLLRKMGFYISDDRPENILHAISAAFPNIKVILLTCGERGAYAYAAADGKLIGVPAKKVVPVSSVGAGDSFIAAFTTAYLCGEPIGSALEKAVALSAYVVSKADAVPEYDYGFFAL